MQRGNDLQQQRVVVVGGSSGIGLAVAQQAATQGAKVVIVSSNAERVQKAVEFISGEAQGHAVNVSDEGAVATFFAKLGSFDHLVFTAGDTLQLNVLEATDLAKPGMLLSCAIGLLWLRSSTQARISARTARSCSQPESQAGARTRDGQRPPASAAA